MPRRGLQGGFCCLLVCRRPGLDLLLKVTTITKKKITQKSSLILSIIFPRYPSLMLFFTISLLPLSHSLSLFLPFPHSFYICQTSKEPQKKTQTSELTNFGFTYYNLKGVRHSSSALSRGHKHWKPPEKRLHCSKYIVNFQERKRWRNGVVQCQPTWHDTKH